MPTETASLSSRVIKGINTGIIALTLSAIGQPLLAAERLYIFTENYPPYNASETGKGFAHNEEDITGICTDMVKAMLSRVDDDYVMKMRDWSYAYNWVQNRENHGLFCTARTDGLVGSLMADEEHGITGLKPVLVFRETPMYLAFNNNTDPAVIEDLQRALDQAREAGEIARIASSYE